MNENDHARSHPASPIRYAQTMQAVVHELIQTHGLGTVLWQILTELNGHSPKAAEGQQTLDKLTILIEDAVDLALSLEECQVWIAH